MPHTNALQRRALQVLIAVVLLALVGSLSFLKAGADPETVVSVNGTEISREAFYDALERYTVNGETLGTIALRQLISEALVAHANESYDLGITEEKVDEEYNVVAEYYGDNLDAMLQELNMDKQRLREEIRISLILDELLVKDVVVTEEDVKAFYEENKATEFVRPELYRPSQILVETEDEAVAILEELAGGATFADLRTEHSLDRADWGAVSKSDVIPKEIADVLFGLQVGEVSDPIKTEAGFYLIQLEEILPEYEYSYEEVAESIREYLVYSQAPSVDEVVNGLWNEAQIQVNWDRYKVLESVSQ